MTLFVDGKYSLVHTINIPIKVNFSTSSCLENRPMTTIPIQKYRSVNSPHKSKTW